MFSLNQLILVLETMHMNMTEKISNESHEDEWIRISKMYLDLAEDESINDIYYYRHRCIEGLLTGHTNDYGRI